MDLALLLAFYVSSAVFFLFYMAMVHARALSLPLADFLFGHKFQEVFDVVDTETRVPTKVVYHCSRCGQYSTFDLNRGTHG